MKLRGVDFGPVQGASGVEGFFGEGYKYHKWLGPLGPDFEGMTFVAKTTTLEARPGNMPLRQDGITPVHFKPSCIYVRWFKGVALNSVGLSGPGAKALLEDGRWQERTKPFWISFMSVAGTHEERMAELRAFVKLLLEYKESFQAPFGLQINLSCPNVGLAVGSAGDEFVGQAHEVLDVAAELNVPLQLKLVLTTSPVLVQLISKHEACDSLCVTNALKWGSLPDKINWQGLFGSDESPLAQFGGGALSGWPLLELTADWVRRARALGVSIPINAGGGILRPVDIVTLKEAGADSVFIGSMAFLRPWRVKASIRKAHRVF